MRYKLYIKKLPNGLLYLGKTEQENPYSYLGSGLRWRRAIKKHGYSCKDIDTYVIFETDNFDDLKQKGIFYSKVFRVVDNDNWANMREEDGDGGFGVGDNNVMNRLDVKLKRGPNPSTRPEVKLMRSEHLKKQHKEKGHFFEGVKRPNHSKLMKDNHPTAVKVQHIETGKIFKSLTEAASYFNIGVTTAFNWKQKGKLIKLA